MKKIKLTNSDKITLVDDDDYEWLKDSNWNLQPYGYVQSSIKSKVTLIHRLIMNTPKGMDTDHIDGNKLNNQKENLRIVTRSQNNMNMKKGKRATSKFKGVDFHQNGWRAAIAINNKTTHIGRFKTEIEAAKAYNEKAIELFGEFAKLNKIKGD